MHMFMHILFVGVHSRQRSGEETSKVYLGANCVYEYVCCLRPFQEVCYALTLRPWISEGEEGEREGLESVRYILVFHTPLLHTSGIQTGKDRLGWFVLPLFVLPSDLIGIALILHGILRCTPHIVNR